MKSISFKAKSGFTLIELLVVISIIALLIAILLPMLGSMKASARRAQCLAHQGQILTSFISYAVEHDGRFFYRGSLDDNGEPAVSIVHTSWMGNEALETLANFGYNPTEYLCPDRGPTFIKVETKGTRTSYYHMMGLFPVEGYEPFPGPGVGWTPVWTIDEDPQSVMLGDIIEKNTISPKRTTSSHGSRGLVEGPLGGSEEPSEIGSDGGNVGRLDGSAGWVNQADMVEHPVRGIGVVSGYW